MTAALATGLLWQMPAKPDRAAELAAVAARFTERTGQTANVAHCHPGEIFYHDAIAVWESAAVAKGCLMVGRATQPPRREPTSPPLVCGVPARPTQGATDGN